MGLLADYKKVHFSKGLINLNVAKLLYEFGINLFGVFLPIFLYQQFQDINLVILYFGSSSLAYVLTMPFGAKIMGKIGIRNSMILAVLIRIVYFGSYFFFTTNPVLFAILAATSIVFIRNLFWIPFHTESAILSDKKTRGKQFSIIFGAASLLSIIAPIIAGFILENSVFAVVAVIALVFNLLTIWPLYKIPKSIEEFTWSFKETWQYFLHPFNRRMVTAYAADGMVGAIGSIFWPLFMFSILDEKYRAMGLLTGGIILAGMILRLFIGDLLDRWQKTKLVHIGVGLNATAWLLKTVIVSTFHVFLASTYHTLALIVLRTSLDTLVYEKAADRGHYVDEYTVIKDMSLHSGRVIGLILVGVLLIFLPIQASFVLAAIATLFINFLK